MCRELTFSQCKVKGDLPFRKSRDSILGLLGLPLEGLRLVNHSLNSHGSRIVPCQQHIQDR